jgi:K(+)-stimulated pyrophosphate-energized sodium pump
MIINLVILSGILSLVYGYWAGSSVLKSNAGNEKMQEISLAIQEGAQAYLNRQYTTIAIVGAVICVLMFLFFGDYWVVGGYLIGAILSGAWIYSNVDFSKSKR